MRCQSCGWFTMVLVLFLMGCSHEAGKEDAKPQAMQRKADRQEIASPKPDNQPASDDKKVSLKEKVVGTEEKKSDVHEPSLDELDKLLEIPGERKEESDVVKKSETSLKNKQSESPTELKGISVKPLEAIDGGFLGQSKMFYTVGEGKEGGFSSGTSKGKVRLLRLRHSGKGWDRYFGVGGDNILLAEYGRRTGHNTAEKTESRTIGELKRFKSKHFPPLVLITGENEISLSNDEIEILREYMLKEKGMLFVVNGGGSKFQESWMSAMEQVLPTVKPAVVPLDASIHSSPYHLAPLKVAEGESGVPWGWYDNDRLMCYFSSADLLNLWRDDGTVRLSDAREISFQYGVNIIFQAHMQYSKWVASTFQGSGKASPQPAQPVQGKSKDKKKITDDELDRLLEIP